MKLFLLLAAVLVSAIAEEREHETHLEDLRELPPPEAQQILDKQDLSLNYAPKIDTNVPALRYLGNEQHEVLEDIYLAKQFHGQDGIGGYVYGYSVPDIAKSEKKIAGGDLRGQYSYINGDGQEIKVEYYDDGTGFHHSDNLPKVELIPNEDTPEVKAAKEEHFRIWNELAQQNKNYNPNAPQETYNEPEQPAEEYKGQWDGPEYVPSKEELEPPKDPKGFFYSFDYPVGIIVSDKGRAAGAHNKRDAHAQELFDNTRAILNGHRARRSVPYPYRLVLVRN